MIARILIMAWVWVVAPLRADGATFVVDNAADEVDATPGDGVCGGPRGACTLRAALMETNHLAGPDRVEVPGAVYRLVLLGDGEAGGDLDITDALELVGDGSGLTVIHGHGNHRVLRVEASLQAGGLTIRNGDADGDDGGCVLATAPTTWLDVVWNDCTGLNGGAMWSSASVDIGSAGVHNTLAEEAGGAFWLSGAASLRDVVIVGASAEDPAVIAHAPGDPSTVLHVDGLRVHACEATSGFGVGIHSSGGLAADAVLIGNNAFYTALRVEGDVTIDGLRVVHSATDGAALWASGTGRSSVTDVLVSGSNVGMYLDGAGADLDIVDVRVVASPGYAVKIGDAESVVLYGLSSDLSGTGLIIGSSGTVPGVTATVHDVSITRATGQAFAFGDGWFDVENLVVDRAETAVVFNGTFEFRDVQISGHDGWDAALDVDEDAVVTIEDGAFFDNQNTDCWYCYADFGGAIENRGDLTLVRTTFDGNAASTGGGAILNTGALHIVDSTFVNNIADAGAALYNRAPGFVTVDGSVLEANEAIDGLVMYFEGGTLEVDDSAFVDNHASTFAYEGVGGAIAGYLDGYLRNTTVAGNTVGEHGSALALDGPGTLLLDAVTIAFNRANGDDDRYGYGGGALWIGDDHIVRMRGSILGNNRGGAGDLSQCAVEGSGSLVSAGDNLVEVDCGGVFEASGTDLYGTFAAPLDPRLLAPDLGGGPTPVVALLADSPAIDAGDACPPSDQWDTPRPVDGDGDGVAVCDIGAWEYP